MKVKVGKTPLNKGQVRIISSKSDAHRSLIAAALAEEESVLFVDGWSDDLEATIRCLEALGAEIYKEPSGIEVVPIRRNLDKAVVLDCGESGSTLRFLLPVAAALGKTVTFTGQGRLTERPIGLLLEELEKHGCAVEGEKLPVKLGGKLQSGVFVLPGNVSSQFITGLMFALPLLEGDSEIMLTTEAESRGYINMTLKTLKTLVLQWKKLKQAGKYLVDSPLQVPVCALQKATGAMRLSG